MFRLFKKISKFQVGLRNCCYYGPQPPPKAPLIEELTKTLPPQSSANNTVCPPSPPTNTGLQAVCCPWHTTTVGEAVFGTQDRTIIFKQITYFICLPVILMLSYKLLVHDRQTEEIRPEFKPYEYLAIRNKKFPWGDGNHSLFHNPHKNALPDGYEDDT